MMLKEHKGRMPEGVKTGLRRGILLVSIAFLLFGVIRGEQDTVLTKAVRICLECIGIG